MEGPAGPNSADLIISKRDDRLISVMIGVGKVNGVREIQPLS